MDILAVIEQKGAPAPVPPEIQTLERILHLNQQRVAYPNRKKEAPKKDESKNDRGPETKIPNIDSEILVFTYSRDKTLFAVACVDNTLRLHNAMTGQEMNRFNGHQVAIHCLCFSHDDRTLAAGGGSSAIMLWDIESTAMLGQWQHQKLTPKDSAAVGSIQEYKQHQTPQLAKEIFHEEVFASSVVDIHFTEDGKDLMTEASDRTVIYWDIQGVRAGVHPTMASLY